jgi:serine/threonine protein kinase
MIKEEFISNNGKVYTFDRKTGFKTKNKTVIAITDEGEFFLKEYNQGSREITTLSRLEHKGIILPTDIVRGKNGKYYIVFPYFNESTSLRDLMNTQESIRQPYLLDQRLASVLDHVHSRGIVHLDIKPENILLVECNERYAKLIDFEAAVDLLYEQPNNFFYTPEYTSLEFELKNEVSPAVDIYSYGVILYELLSKQFPRRITSERLRKDFLRKGGYKEYMEYLLSHPQYATSIGILNPEQIDKDCFGKDKKLVSLVKFCTDMDPSNRPKAYDIMSYLESI